MGAREIEEFISFMDCFEDDIFVRRGGIGEEGVVTP